MKKSKRMIVWLSALLAVVPALSACGSKEPLPSEADGQPDTEAVQSGIHQPTELVVYYLGSDGNEERFQTTMGNFVTEKYPNVKLVWKNYNTIPFDALITSREDVDLFYGPMGNYMNLINGGYTGLDLSPLAKKHKVDLSELDSSSVDIFKMMNSGVLNAVPYQLLHLSLAYNKSIFDKFGVPYVRDGMTWEEVNQTAKLITRLDNGVQYIGFGLNQAPAFWRGNPYGAPLFDAAGKSALNSGKWPDVLRTMASFFEIPGNEYLANPVDAFNKEQRVGMITALVSQIPAATFADLGDSLDVVDLPSFADAKGVGSGTNPMFWSVSATSKHPDEAFLAFAHLLSKDVQTKRAEDLSAYPAIRIDRLERILGRNDARMQKMNIKGLIPEKFAPAIKQSEFTNISSTALNTALKAVVEGKSDVNTALRQAKEEVDQKIAAAGK